MITTSSDWAGRRRRPNPVFERQIHLGELSDRFEIGLLLGGSTDTRYALCALSLGRGLIQVMDSIAADLQDCTDVFLKLASWDFWLS